MHSKFVFKPTILGMSRTVANVKCSTNNVFNEVQIVPSFPEKCSARLYGSYWDIPGGDIKLPKGYKTLFQEDVGRLEHCNLEFGAEVTHIHWGQDKIRIQIADDEEEKTITADHVIVTVPLGVLKKNMGAMFDPELPEAKVRTVVSCPDSQ